MKEIAQKNNEFCTCWTSSEPLIKFEGNKDFDIKVECKEKKEECVQDFRVTERELVDKFKIFYKG